MPPGKKETTMSARNKTRNKTRSKTRNKTRSETRDKTRDRQAPNAALAGAKRLTVAIGREAAANFRAWFERNFMNPRAGRIGGVSYSRAGALDDRPGDWTWYPSAYGRAFWDHTEPLTPDEEDYLRTHPLVLLQLALGVTDLRGLRCLRRGLTLRANALQRRAYRSRYYARDNARRRELAAERRKIRRRTTLSPCPTPEEFRAAFARVKESAEAKIRFGGMVHDLACYVDSCLRYDGSGNIVGRNGGIRAWIAENVPELSPRYKTIMRHKALAMRARQLAGLEDPQPTSVLLDGPADGQSGRSGGEVGLSSEPCAKERGNETGIRSETRRPKGPTGLENYSAQDSHLVRKQRLGRVLEQRRGQVRQALERQQGQTRQALERQHGQTRQALERQHGQTRQALERQHGQTRQALEQKREQLKRVLAECQNTFKDVFDRIDSELGQDESGLG